MKILFLITAILITTNFQINGQGADQTRPSFYFKPNTSLLNTALSQRQSEYDAQKKAEMEICVQELKNYLSKYNSFKPVESGRNNVKVLGADICGYADVLVNRDGIVTDYYVGNTGYRVVASERTDEKQVVTISVQFNNSWVEPVLIIFYNNYYNQNSGGMGGNGMD